LIGVHLKTNRGKKKNVELFNWLKLENKKKEDNDVALV
jgi:hypothetical protein